jgi:iron complex outermembrane recepter protein
MSTWDVLLSYTGFQNVVLSLGARNIFDTKPDGVFIDSGNAFQNGYDPTQYDPRGRFVYLTGSFKF